MSSLKGKSRAVDEPPSAVGGSSGAMNMSSEAYVIPQPIPSTTFVNIEYPGIVPLDDIKGSSSTSSYSSLDRALSTLHPSALPPLTSTPHAALDFLSSISNEGIHVVECRLGSFGRSHSANDRAEDSSQDIDEVYRTPLSGEAVQTHNLVVRVVKRTWREKKRKRQASDLDIDPAFDTSVAEYTGRVRKEYKVQILGMVTKTVRFRSPADFAFRPETHVASSSALDPVMSLHRALATMDLEALKQFRVPEQTEEYEVASSGASPKSNLRMIPPACFSRLDVPFTYNFQQSPYSDLRIVPRPPHMQELLEPVTDNTFTSKPGQVTLSKDQMYRFVNKVRLSNIAPQPFRLGRDAQIPIEPLPDVLKIERRCDPKILHRLRELLAKRPIWSRVAFKNQLTAQELFELEGTNAKVYFAMVGYAMIGGAWRDTVVRFGYDPRTDPNSRNFQRVFLRSAASTAGRAGDTREGTHVGNDDDDMDDEEGAASHGRSNSPRRRVSIPIFNSRNGDSELSTPDNAPEASRSTTTRNQNSHQFDGRTLNRNIGNFQLCDVTDPYMQPYIQGDVSRLIAGQITWLRDTCDPETGWYTRRALELIRALISARFKALLEPHSTPLPKADFDAIVDRFQRRWADEDSTESGSGA